MSTNPIDQFIAKYPPEIQTILQKIRALIQKIHTQYGVIEYG